MNSLKEYIEDKIWDVKFWFSRKLYRLRTINISNKIKALQYRLTNRDKIKTVRDYIALILQNKYMTSIPDHLLLSKGIKKLSHTAKMIKSYGPKLN